MANNSWFKVDMVGYPREDGKYFVVLTNGNFKVASYSKDKGFYYEDDNYFIYEDVKYWMNLPKLPNLENEIRGFNK